MTGDLFARLRAASGAIWPAYTRHDFVLRLAQGDLPEAAFRRYLVQDYLFLLHFARAWGLAIYKSETLAEMRRAQAQGDAARRQPLPRMARHVCRRGIPEPRARSRDGARRAVSAARRRRSVSRLGHRVCDRDPARSRFLVNGSKRRTLTPLADIDLAGT